MKRSQQKRLTHQSKILQFMRRSKRIPMREAGRRINFSASTISHIEQGRMDVSAERIQLLVESYGYTMPEFEEYMAGKTIPVLSIKEECFSLIDQLDESKLRAVHGMLVGFAR